MERPRILALVLLFLWGCSSPQRAPTGAVPKLKPTVLLISIDGFRADYLEKYRPPTLTALAAAGVRARWMIPAFPTVTFPNHHSMVTGLYPAHHGVFDNSSIVPLFGEPIWVTAIRQGQKAAAMFWPGTDQEIQGVRPAYYHEYRDDFPIQEKIEEPLKWLDLPEAERPTLITMYFPDVDHDGHQFGPDGAGKAVADVDAILGKLFERLRERGLENQLNIIIVSDHGMAELSFKVTIDLRSLLPSKGVDFWNQGSHATLNVRSGNEQEIRELYEKLRATTREGGGKLPMSVYLRDQMPARFHFESIAEKTTPFGQIVCIAQAGTVFQKNYSKGGHGFDNAAPEMRAFFIAKGPAFAEHALVEPFENVNVQPMIAAILGLKAPKSDGKLENVPGVLRGKH